MKNKHYNIFFTSEKDGIGRSFRLSKVSLCSVALLFFCIMGLSFIGLNRTIGYDILYNELNQLREYKYVTSNLLIESGIKEKTLESEDLEKLIIEYILENNLVYPSVPPVDGYVTRGVIKNDKDIVYAGINIASKIQDHVKSPLDGLVVIAENNKELGCTIILHHQNNFFTIYKNLDTLLVKPRDLVLKNEIIAKVGDINNDGSHLQFEIWKDNQVIDPRNLIVDYKEKDVSIR